MFFFKIVRYATKLIENDHLYESMASAINPYGDGQASARILSALTAG
jgi:UDP-N-acetylglucosamine 2-epimerase